MINKKLNRIAIITFLCVILIYGLYSIKKTFKDEYNLSKSHRFSIAQIDTIKRSGKGWVIKYDFKINGIKFTSYNGIDDYDKSIIKSKFYVKYYSVNPINSKILLDLPFSDSISKVPLNGWGELPVNINNND